MTMLIILINFGVLTAQVYDDYIGAGHSQGVWVSSSSNLQKPGWSQIASGEKTINGAGMEGKLSEAARFLTQATISHDLEEINLVAEIGMEAWIASQISQPYTTYSSIMNQVHNDYNTYLLSQNREEQPRPYSVLQRTTWWRMNMLHRDFLRDKVALALSEILVISSNSSIESLGFGIMDYYDILKRNAFGNYEDILLEITLHPIMGGYLSHYNNPKADSTNNVHPDENYAREIMQLFSIGLYELNNDGSRKTNPDGSFIPTYDNQDIEEFAKVFTGLGPGGIYIPGAPLNFGLPLWNNDNTVPMTMYEAYHEPSEKALLNDFVIPAGQPGMTDIAMAINHLFNHPNVGPFISKRLIQLFVKSNPTPAYINRVATVFNTDENGVRGNMEAVIKKILLDEEARSCEWINHATQGKLKNPTEKSVQFTKVIDLDIASGEIWTDGNDMLYKVAHRPLQAPSVFNFHSPAFQPTGAIGDAGMVAPEFEIFNATTAVGYGNLIWRWLYYWNEYGGGAGIWQDDSHRINVNLNAYLEAAQDAEVLINQLDLQLTNGNLSEHTRNVIKAFITTMNPNEFPNANVYLEDYNTEKVKQVLNLILMSPDFNILK